MSQHQIVEVSQSPRDYISDVVLLDDRVQMAVTSWDGKLSIYDFGDKKTVTLNTVLQYRYPLLSCCYLSTSLGRQIYVSSVQGEILHVDLESVRFNTIRNNEARLGIPCICPFRGNLLCGSWDGLLQVVDCNTNSVVMQRRLGQGVKILSMDINEDKLIVATSGNKVCWFKLPLDGSEGIEVESGLKYQARRIKLIPKGDGYVSSSLDGRVAVEFFDDETRKFAFRCHRLNLVDTNLVFPVNALSFLPDTNILYTGGSDGCVSCWNLTTRKKVEQLPKFNENSVVQLTCNKKVLCVATSDDSFKTNATKDVDVQLQPSRLYIVFL